MIRSKNVESTNYILEGTRRLSTPYPSFTETLQGGFIRGESTLICGISGSGLSMFIASLIVTMLENPEINVLHFNFNESPVKRKARLVFNKNHKFVEEELKYYSNKNLEYNDNYLNCTQILEYALNYKDSHNYTVIIIEDIFDILRVNEKNDFDLAVSIKQLINTLKRHKFIVICTNRFNENIEKEQRIFNYNFHYPVRSDIYNENYILNAFNNVYAFHNPMLLNIKEYGVEKRQTKDLIHIRKLKTNEGKLSQFWLRNVLQNGHFVELENNPLKI